MKIRKADEVTGHKVDLSGASGVIFRSLIGEEDGAPNFHMRQFNVAPGGHTPKHQHDWEHEVYILAGRGVVPTTDGERQVAPGDCVFVEPGELHQFINTGDEELKFLCLVPKKDT